MVQSCVKAAAAALALSVGFASAETIYTGDTLLGYPVIEKLDVADLEAGNHRFYFRVIGDAIGGYQHVPVLVAKGAQDGPKLVLQAALHGDELAGVAVIHEVMPNIEPATLNGAVVAVPGANPVAMLNHSRYFTSPGSGGSQTNLNRVMPGSENSSDDGKRFAYALWNKLYAGNADVVLDLHTQSRGTAYSFFVYADLRDEGVARIAKVLPPDQIKDDLGQDGTFETEMVKAGVPAVTVELGAPKVYDDDMTARGARGVYNTMIEFGLIEGDIDMMGVETFFGNSMTSICATEGGFGEILVELNQDVVEGELVAVQRNAFGDVIAEYNAPWDGKVLAVATDPMRAPGSLMVRMLRQKDAE